MSADYHVLAPIYQTLGMTDYAAGMMPQLFLYAQANFDWVGRKALDLGSGIGLTSRYLANRGMNVTALDLSPEMLTVARGGADSSGLGLQWIPGDVRALPASIDEIDIVFALDMMNDLNTLRDLEQAFQQIWRVLGAGKLFLFDLITLEGLAERGRRSGLLHDDGELTVFAQNHFDYDRQANTTHYTVFRRERDLWARDEAYQTLRGFPVQAVSALVQRAGFHLAATLTPALKPFDTGVVSGERVIFVAQKPDADASSE